MTTFVLLLALFFAPMGAHWIKVKDSYRIHRLYVTHYGNEIGGYYQPYKPTFQAQDLPVPFTAQCWEGKPVEFATEAEAREFVLRCPL